jgi:hypothetical protein
VDINLPEPRKLTFESTARDTTGSIFRTAFYYGQDEIRGDGAFSRSWRRGDVHRLSRRIHAVLGSRFQRPLLMETSAHEGPVYVAVEHALYFTTVPVPGPKNISIKRRQLAGDEFPFKAQALDIVQSASSACRIISAPSTCMTAAICVTNACSP